ncbi:hypothetical protein ASG77_03405 [Arthrobacter sp. Soil762]|nr:hypothetical protein ASG77_03405 [Arthrobacter sp. Soil762]
MCDLAFVIADEFPILTECAMTNFGDGQSGRYRKSEVRIECPETDGIYTAGAQPLRQVGHAVDDVRGGSASTRHRSNGSIVANEVESNLVRPTESDSIRSNSPADAAWAFGAKDCSSRPWRSG